MELTKVDWVLITICIFLVLAGIICDTVLGHGEDVEIEGLMLADGRVFFNDVIYIKEDHFYVAVVLTALSACAIGLAIGSFYVRD